MIDPDLNKHRGAPKLPIGMPSSIVAAQRLMQRWFSGGVLTASEARRLESQIKDFAGGGLTLIPQRQGIYLGALVLTSFFFSFNLAIICYLICQFAEILDTIVCLRVMRWKQPSPRKAALFYRQLFFTSTLSSIAVCMFVLLVAELEGPGNHFTSLFFLFAAGLFAAVNNHQLPKVLAVRLVLYGAVFLYVPIKDIVVLRPPIRDELYLHLATVVFVLFFVLECSVIFLRLYQKGLVQLEELRIERDRAKEVYELKSQFVSVVSHELRTPLTSIVGALGLMKSDKILQDQKSFENILGIAEKNSARLSNLINDLLDLQKLESDEMNYEFAEIDPAIVAQDSIDAISIHAERKGVEVHGNFGDQELWIQGDHPRLLQVMDNLLSNAIKFSEPGGRVDVFVTTDEANAVLCVQDHGVGIPEGSEDIVFGKFSQVDSTDHRAHEGTGLGLNIVQKIVSAHDGTVSYESVLGEGTKFFVRIPLVS